MLTGPLSHGIVRTSMRDWVKRTAVVFSDGPIRLFVTGGTGFFGSWVLASVRALREAGKDIEVDVLSRNPSKFLAANPEFATLSGFRFHQGDVADCKIPDGITHLMHFATTPTDQGRDDAGLRRTIVDGTRHVLNESERVGIERFLFASSGAVYGAKYSDQASEAEFPPSWNRGVNSPDVTAYGTAKREAEKLCFERSDKLSTVMIRAFAFSGPLFPLDAPYALSNFMMSLIKSQAISVRSPKTVRSYLDGQDLVEALWELTLNGAAGAAYNVGAAETVTMSELARHVQRLAKDITGREIEVQTGQSLAEDVYVPDISRLQKERGWKPHVTLADSLKSQAEWALSVLNSSTK